MAHSLLSVSACAGRTFVFPLLLAAVFCAASCGSRADEAPAFESVRTLHSFFTDVEPFGIAERDGVVYISDGRGGKLLAIDLDGGPCLNPMGCYRGPRTITDKLHTPSHITIEEDGSILVADSGDHTVKRVSQDGVVSVVAGRTGEAGLRDGPAADSLFRAPVGIAVREGKIFVADTYNDRIRVIENGEVRTLAGSERGMANSAEGSGAKFDTPSGIDLLPDGTLLVADLGNKRIRLVGPDGKTSIYAGDGRVRVRDGSPLEASFSGPTDIALGRGGEIFVADGGTVRVIGARFLPIVETLSDTTRGFMDGDSRKARFNRAGGIAVSGEGDVFVADSDNHLVRAIGGRIGEIVSEEAFLKGIEPPFDGGAPPMKWPYDPPDAVREIAGTFGEIRGELETNDSTAYLHNGLDITGAYGETARFVKDEKVLDPEAVQNVGTLRELLRLPWHAYIHVNVGRTTDGEIYDDPRFLVEGSSDGARNVRVPRGTEFKAGEKVGTLNRMNHVHLVVGYPGREMNGLGASGLPGIEDSRIPVIEKVELYRENWQLLETRDGEDRITVNGRVRVVAEAYDQMDGNPDRRRLGVYAVGYRLIDGSGRQIGGSGKEPFRIFFDRLPDPDFADYIYARESRSGATGPTVFRYIATNRLIGGRISKGFIDFSKLPEGEYTIEVVVRDYKGNQATKTVEIRSGRDL